MLNKYSLFKQILKSLTSNDFSVFLSKGCFNIAAKKDYKLLIKFSFNLDSLREEHALSLRAISYFTSAYPLIVSVKNNRGPLNNKVVYSRFNTPVVTPKMLECLVEEEDVPFIQSTKGKHLTWIDSRMMRKRRKEKGIGLGQLSKLTGISKKCLYEIENEKVRPTIETVEKIEKVLGVNIKRRFEFKEPIPAFLKPRDEFQKIISKEFERIGMENSCVYAAPFEIIGREGKTLITRLVRRQREIENSKNIKLLSEFFSSRAIFVAKEKKLEEINEIPVFSEEEIKSVENLEEFEKMIEEKIC